MLLSLPNTLTEETGQRCVCTWGEESASAAGERLNVKRLIAKLCGEQQGVRGNEAGEIAVSCGETGL